MLKPSSSTLYVVKKVLVAYVHTHKLSHTHTLTHTKTHTQQTSIARHTCAHDHITHNLAQTITLHGPDRGIHVRFFTVGCAHTRPYKGVSDA